MRLYTLIFFAILSGCAEKNLAYEDQLEVIKEYNNFTEVDSSLPVWVCNHPNTKYHNKPCIEAEYPNGCYIEGDNGKFCWLLTEEDCKEGINYEAGWTYLCK
tara:strand:+ start:1126 stop:1431 length:306 start_codon:yes stop_codon:yes gene_type:complete